MKRLFAIVILNIFLLNVLGYYAALLGWKVASGQEFAARLDSDMYDLGSKVTFHIPLAVPYGTDMEFEPTNGQFEKDGIVYRIVKQRLHKDILYIECIKDEATSEINRSLSDFVQSFAGHDDDSQQKTVSPGFIKDYVDFHVSITASNNGWEKDMSLAATVPVFVDSYYASIVHPPDRA